MPEDLTTDDKVRLCVWLDKSKVEQFRSVHPNHGALTQFLRDSFETYASGPMGANMQILFIQTEEAQ